MADQIFAILKKFKVRQVTYVPDGGHAKLIRQVHADPAMIPVTLTTEEEGVAILAGAWMGGDRGVLLMQSSGVGNCINMLSLVKTINFRSSRSSRCAASSVNSIRGRCRWAPPRPVRWN